MSYKVAGKEWADIYFKLHHNDGTKSKYMCNLCPEGSQLYTSAKGHGYTPVVVKLKDRFLSIKFTIQDLKLASGHSVMVN